MTTEQTKSAVHAFGDDVLDHLDATGIARRIRDQEISISEAVDAAIQRASLVQDHLHGLRHFDFDAARYKATTALPPAVFRGVPTAFKDNIHVKGLPCTEGSSALPATPSRSDGPVAKQFLRTGLIPIGVSAMPEIGLTPSSETLEYQVRNPWNTSHTPGGSSSGAAALVAAGVVPIAHGNDAGGSIRIPAACTGLVGLKPSRGRLQSELAHRVMPIQLVHQGVLARSVRDVAGFYAEAEHCQRNKSLPPIGIVDQPIRQSLRVALVLDSPFGPPTDITTRIAVERFANQLETLGHRVEPATLDPPQILLEDLLAYWYLLAIPVVHGGKIVFGKDFNPARLEPFTRYLAAQGWLNLRKRPLATACLARTAHTLGNFLYDRGGFDVILNPVVSHVTPRIGHLGPDVDPEVHFRRATDWCSFTLLQNITGEPSISLPAGLTKDNLPIGALLSAPRGHERRLLELALQIEQANPWPRIQDKS